MASTGTFDQEWNTYPLNVLMADVAEVCAVIKGPMGNGLLTEGKR